MAKTAVIGAGSWGTALSLVLHTNGNDVTVWSIVEQYRCSVKNTSMWINFRE